jgi:predicted nucleic acid-binding protein
VTEAVLDASVVLKWFHTEGERHVEQARRLRARFRAGELRVLAPSLLWLELLNVAGRRWGWSQTQLEALAAALPNLGFDVHEPQLPTVAHWVTRGLTAYDAAYVAVAEDAGVKLITDDDEIVRVATKTASALAEESEPHRGI